MTTETLIESEVKLALASEHEWARLREALGPPQRRIAQTNTYFDTRDQRLRRGRRLMVRVRQTSDRLEVTAKDRVASEPGASTLRSRERNAALTEKQWRAVHRGRCALTELPIPLCAELHAEAGDHLYPLGSIVNTREEYPLAGGYLAEVDRTELPGGRVDYEVELEFRQPEHTAQGALNALRDAAPGIDSLVFTGEPTPKYARFLEAMGLD